MHIILHFTIMTEYCACIDNKGNITQRVKDIWDEVLEFLFELWLLLCFLMPWSCATKRDIATVWDNILDEWSDIAFGFGRLFGNLVGRPYIPVWGAGRHEKKIEKRMTTFGCVRSSRHLDNGKCPSAC